MPKISVHFARRMSVGHSIEGRESVVTRFSEVEATEPAAMASRLPETTLSHFGFIRDARPGADERGHRRCHGRTVDAGLDPTEVADIDLDTALRILDEKVVDPPR